MTIPEALDLADRLFLLSRRIYRAATAARESGQVDLSEFQIKEHFADALKKGGLTNEEIKRLLDPEKDS